MLVDQLQLLLEEEERTRQIKILRVIGVGSRAWGIHTSASDYDLAVVYVQMPWGRTIAAAADNEFRMSAKIEDKRFDIQAFELHKVYGMIVRSDPYMNTLLRSEIVYAHSPKADMHMDLVHYFNRNAVYNALMGQASRFKSVRGNVTFPAKNALQSLHALVMAERLRRNGKYALDVNIPDVIHELRASELQDTVFGSVDRLEACLSALIHAKATTPNMDVRDTEAMRVIASSFKYENLSDPLHGEKNIDLSRAQANYERISKSSVEDHQLIWRNVPHGTDPEY